MKIPHINNLTEKASILLLTLAMFSFSVAANEVSKLVESQSLEGRAYILNKLLHQSGKKCDGATRTFLQGYDRDSAAYWNVSCSNGQAYNVQIPADPSANTRILECSIMEAIGVKCFEKFSN